MYFYFWGQVGVKYLFGNIQFLGFIMFGVYVGCLGIGVGEVYVVSVLGNGFCWGLGRRNQLDLFCFLEGLIRGVLLVLGSWQYSFLVGWGWGGFILQVGVGFQFFMVFVGGSFIFGVLGDLV